MPKRLWVQNVLKLASTFSLFLLVSMTVTVLVPGPTQAEKLKDVIPGLYGGNGFQVTASGGGGSTSADFALNSLNDLNDLTNGITSQLGQFAVNSTVGGVTFDMERGIPVEVSQSPGPLFGELANTIGKGRLNFQVNWSYAKYDKFNGQNLSSLETTAQASLQPGQQPTTDQLKTVTDVTVITNFVGFYGTYGLTDFWDVNLVVPIVTTKLKAKANSQLVDANGIPCPQQPGGGTGNCSGRYSIVPGQFDSPKDTRSSESTGIGDIILRSKYRFLEEHPIAPDLAVRGDVSFPTGNEDNFQGLGDFRFAALAIASKYYSSPIGMIGPHVNTGVSIVNNQSSRNAFTYVAGFDVAPVPTVAVSLDLLGRHELNDKDNSGKDIVDLAPGFKWAPYPNTVVQAAVILPLNINEGLRANQTWTAGFGGTF